MIFLPFFSQLTPDADSIIGGGKGVATHIQVGTWWNGIRVQYGYDNGLGVILEAQSALFKRWQPSLGVFSVWHDKGVRITGSMLGGWLIQEGTQPKLGPSAEFRIQIARAKGRIRPWILLSTKHSFGYLQSIYQSREGDIVEHELQHEWSLPGSLGVTFRVHRSWDIGLGLDMPWINVPDITIPGAHLSVAYRGQP